MSEHELRKARFEFNRYGFNPVGRIWRAANRKREAERQTEHDRRLTAHIENHACTVECHVRLCGAPLDDDGLCEIHE